MSNYTIAQLDEVPAQRCPCGFTQRAFAGSPDNVASLRILDGEELKHRDAEIAELKRAVEELRRFASRLSPGTENR